MRDKFADLEEPRSGNVIGVLAVTLIVGLFLAFHWSGAAPIRVTGIVDASGPVSVAKISGGTRERATVRLSNGAIVFAYVVFGGPLSPGDKVVLLEEHRLLGGPVYQVVAKDRGTEP